MARSFNINPRLLESVLEEPKNNTPYSKKELHCKGLACAKRGRCHDLYWSPRD
jgi:hypothetical protein